MKSVHPIVKKLEIISKHSIFLPQKESAATYQSYISAKNLSFSYDGTTDILSGIDCLIEKGKKYVIVGKSGCGKSTLVKLLSGYYSTYKGEILYDNTEFHMLDKDSVVQLSSIIHQNIYLFDETIYDNICLHEHYPEEQVEKVIKDSGLTEFISELPTGLQYRVGENAVSYTHLFPMFPPDRIEAALLFPAPYGRHHRQNARFCSMRLSLSCLRRLRSSALLLP